MTGQLLRLGSDGQTLATRPGSSALVTFKAGLRRLRVRSNITPNKSFKPNPLRSGNGVAEKACHAVACTAQVGLTQALGPMSPSFLAVAGLGAFALLLCTHPIRDSAPRLVALLACISFMLFGSSILVLSADLYQSGEALALSRPTHGHVLRSVSPIYFWISTTFITTGGVVLSVFSLYLLHIVFLRRRHVA